MMIFGKKARIFIEIEMDSGDRFQYPIDAATYVIHETGSGDTFPLPGSEPWGEIRIPIHGREFIHKVLKDMDDYKMQTGRS